MEAWHGHFWGAALEPPNLSRHDIPSAARLTHFTFTSAPRLIPSFLARLARQLQKPSLAIYTYRSISPSTDLQRTPYLDLQRALALDFQHTLSRIIGNPHKRDISDLVKLLAQKLFYDCKNQVSIKILSSAQNRDRVLTVFISINLTVYTVRPPWGPTKS